MRTRAAGTARARKVDKCCERCTQRRSGGGAACGTPKSFAMVLWDVTFAAWMARGEDARVQCTGQGCRIAAGRGSVLRCGPCKRWRALCPWQRTEQPPQATGCRGQRRSNANLRGVVPVYPHSLQMSFDGDLRQRGIARHELRQATRTHLEAAGDARGCRRVPTAPRPSLDCKRADSNTIGPPSSRLFCSLFADLAHPHQQRQHCKAQQSRTRPPAGPEEA